MADKATILQNAQRYMAKGHLDKAIEEWHKLISEAPNDGNIYNTIGDLLLKKNDLNKAVEAYLKGAEVFHSAGFSLKTIAIYKKLIKLVPQRFDIIIKLGDLNAERGLTGNAIEDYLTAAKQYSQEGHIKEALEIYRKIANLDPSNTSIRMKLADLCLKEGLQQEALDEFVKVAESYIQMSQIKEAEVLCERILKLDPKNEAARRLMSSPDASPEPSAKPESISKEQLLSQIDASIDKGLLDKAQEFLQLFIEQYPQDPGGPSRLGSVFLKEGKKDDAFASLKTAAEHYVDRSEFGQAGKLMKDYLETDPDRVEAHTLLAEAYEKGGNPRLAVSAYAHVIDEYLASGETAQARSLYAKIKMLEPQHRDVRRLRHSFESAEVSQPRVDPVDEDQLHEPASVPFPAAIPADEPSHSVSEPVSPPAEPAPIIDAAALHSLLTEAEVYLKYGLSSKAIEQIQQALAMDPENEQAHLQLKDIYKSEGQTEKAVDECFHLIQIYKRMDNDERRTAVLEEAKELDPENARIREATDLAPILDSGRMKAILEEEEIGKGTSSSIGEAARRESVSIEDTKAEVSSGSLRGKEDLAEQAAEADFYYQQGLREEAKKMYELILTLQPDHSDTIHKLESIVAEEALENEKKAQKSNAEKPSTRAAEPSPQPKKKDSAQSREPQKPTPVHSKSADEQKLDEELDKSFAPFMSGDRDESVETLALAAAGSPKETESTVDLEGLVQDEGIETKRTRKRDSPLEKGGMAREEFIDLSSIFDDKVKENVERSIPKISAEEKSVTEELDSIFSEFQKDAQEQIDDIDYETHYNLGIAYKEMGLLNEAMIEFKQAMKGPDRFIDASNMLAACHQESGNDQDAIELLENALSDSRCDETQSRWLRYDLASLYEKESRHEEALTLFGEVARSDRNFKDVVQRIENLEGHLGTPKRKGQTVKDAGNDDEDVDAMMERVFGETSPSTHSKGGKESVRKNSNDDAKKKDRISYL